MNYLNNNLNEYTHLDNKYLYLYNNDIFHPVYSNYYNQNGKIRLYKYNNTFLQGVQQLMPITKISDTEYRIITHGTNFHIFGGVNIYDKTSNSCTIKVYYHNNNDNSNTELYSMVKSRFCNYKFIIIDVFHTKGSNWDDASYFKIICDSNTCILDCSTLQCVNFY